MKKRWYITYKIKDIATLYEAGPYSIEELEIEKYNIENICSSYDITVIEKLQPKNSSRPNQ